MQQKSRGGIVLKDLNDVTYSQIYIESNQPKTQVYSQEGNIYLPDFTVAPYLVLSPFISTSGQAGTNGATIAGRVVAGTSVWRLNNVLLAQGVDYDIQDVAPFKLTVKKNINNGSASSTFTWKAKILDPGTKQQIDVQAEWSLATVMNASAGLQALIDPVTGETFTDQEPALSFDAIGVRGGTPLTANVTYLWEIRDFGVFAPTTTTAASATTVNKVTLASVNALIAGSQLMIGGNLYTAKVVNTATKEVTLDKNLITAVATGAAVTNPYYTPEGGAGFAKITNAPYFNGITGFDQKRVTIPRAAVLNRATLRVTVTDTSVGQVTSGKSAKAIQTVYDDTDPIKVEVFSKNGDQAVRGMSQFELTAYVYQGGAEVDATGSRFTYQWDKLTIANNSLVTNYKAGKNIVVPTSDVDSEVFISVTLSE